MLVLGDALPCRFVEAVLRLDGVDPQTGHIIVVAASSIVKKEHWTQADLRDQLGWVAPMGLGVLVDGWDRDFLSSADDDGGRKLSREGVDGPYDRSSAQLGRIERHDSGAHLLRDQFLELGHLCFGRLPVPGEILH